MDISNGVETEVSGSSSLEEVKSDPIETGSPSNAPAPETGGQTSPPDAPPPPSYAPNFKYKVLKEEKEFPEWVRAVVTNEEMEKTIRDVFERADGIEPVKAHRDQLLEFQRQNAPFIQDAHEALEFVRKGDLQSFFERVGIPEKELFKYAHQRLQLLEDPKALSAHEEKRAAELKIAQLMEQNTQLSVGQQQLAIQQREFELSSHLGRPEISSVAQAFDAVQGPGSFRKQVILRGQAYAAQGTDLPVETVVAEVAQLIGWQGQKPTPQPTSPAETGTRTPPPSLPNIQGTGRSPAKRVARSTDDLRRMARELDNR